ncbi:MAG: YraN family protein [Alphaproteobacteria bacterium]|nr:YraN family protein [Alphaproteobacteria bacterium]
MTKAGKTRAEARRRHEKAGRGAEALAALYLMAKGYGVLATRFRSPAGEIDLIARRGRCLVFVEVKRRADLGTAGESISPAQRSRIAAAAGHYLARHPALAGLDCRFDAILIAPGRLPRHLRDAWQAG